MGAMMNIRLLLKQYSLNKLSTITGISVEVIKDLRDGKIPDHITMRAGSHVAARSVLNDQLDAAVKSYKRKIKADHAG